MNEYFAQVKNNRVLQVIVADQLFIDSGAAGDPSEWMTAFRTRLASAGDTYRADIDAFVAPQPWPSWTLDPASAQWQPPVARPTVGYWRWSETDQEWQEVIPLS